MGWGGGGRCPTRVGPRGGTGAQTVFCQAEDAAQGSWMLPHLAKFANMFGLKSSAGSYAKMQNEFSLDAENPFCSQVGASAPGCSLDGGGFTGQC